jgi:hydrogenase expression/formation protein HypE
MEGRNGAARTESEVLAAIEARRRRPPVRILDDQVTLAHGAGGKSSRTLVEGVFLKRLANPALEALGTAPSTTSRWPARGRSV